MFKVTPGAWVEVINAFIWWQITDLYHVRIIPLKVQIFTVTVILFCLNDCNHKKKNYHGGDSFLK